MQDLMPQPPCIGIVAGAGPEAGLAFWRQVLAASRRRQGRAYRGDVDAPRVRIISEPVLGHVTELDAHREILLAALRAILAELDAACHRIVVACHALQGLAMEAEPAIAQRKLVFLPQTACDHVRENGLERVGFFGAPSVAADAARSPYRDLWKMTAVEPPKDPAAALALILEAKRIGAGHPQVMEKLAALLSSYEADRVLLACTDFSGLALSVDGKQVVDILDLAAEAVTAP